MKDLAVLGSWPASRGAVRDRDHCIAVTVSKLCFLMALYEQNNFTLKSAIEKNVSMVGIPGTLYRLECTFQVYSYCLDFFFTHWHLQWYIYKVRILLWYMITRYRGQGIYVGVEMNLCNWVPACIFTPVTVTFNIYFSTHILAKI